MARKLSRQKRSKAWEQSHPTTIMHLAQTAMSQGMPFKTAYEKFGLHRLAIKRRYNFTHEVPDKSSAARPLFNLQHELELVQHVKLLIGHMYGVTKKDIRYIAFHLAEHYNLPHNFNFFEGLAGKDWLDGFLKRRPEIIPRLTSCFAEQDKDYNKSMVSRFFRKLREAMTENLYPAHRIFSAGEMSFTSGSAKCLKNRAGRFVELVGSNFEYFSSVVCMSAGGHFIPPMMTFHRKCIKMEMLAGAPQGTVFACNNHGWVVANVFQAWFQHFLKVTRPTCEDPVLLVLEDYLLHTKNVEVAMKAKESFVTVIFLPPLQLFSRKLNPIEGCVTEVLTECYERNIEDILEAKMEVKGKSPPKNVRKEKITPIFAKAYAQASTANNAVNGFWKCGIYPFDPDIFAEEDFETELTLSSSSSNKFQMRL